MWIELKNLVNKKQKHLNTLKQEEYKQSFIWTKTIREIYPEAEKFTEYKGLQQGVICITVSDVIWISELNLYKDKIKHNLTSYGFTGITDIKFTL